MRRCTLLLLFFSLLALPVSAGTPWGLDMKDGDNLVFDPSVPGGLRGEPAITSSAPAEDYCTRKGRITFTPQGRMYVCPKGGNSAAVGVTTGEGGTNYTTLTPSAPAKFGKETIYDEAGTGHYTEGPDGPITILLKSGAPFVIGVESTSTTDRLELWKFDPVTKALSLLNGATLPTPTGSVSVLTYGAIANDELDDSAAFQAAIDAAQALIYQSTGVPDIIVPSGEYSLASPIVWKSGSIKCSTASSGVRIYWDGTAGSTVITKLAATHSTGILENCAFRNGTTRPGTWIEFSEQIDAMLRLRDNHFVGSSGDAIKVSNGWHNFHLYNTRFDCIGGYALRLVVHTGLNKASFTDDGGTYDWGTGCTQTNAPGYMLIDNDVANSSNVGVIEIANKRIEVNTAWAVTPRAVVHLKKKATGANPRSVVTVIRNVTFDDAAAMTDDALVHLEGGGGTECVVLQNVRANVGSTLSGSWTAGAFIAVPSSVGYTLATESCGDLISFGNTPLSLRNITPTTAVLQIHTGAETVARLAVDAAGKSCWSDGTNACDTTLYRSGANLLKTDHAFMVTDKFRTTGTAPAISACGTSPTLTNSSDSAGKLTAGTGTVTSCLLTFTAAWPTSSVPCIAQNETTEQTMKAVATTTTLTISSATDFASDVISYICVGRR